MALTKAVVSAVPFHLTADPDRKFVPLTVSVNAAPPTVAPVGDTDAIVGAGLLIARVVAAVVPPPGAGLVTVTLAAPAVAISIAGTCAEICVAPVKLVANAVSFQLITELDTKLAPVTVSVKAVPPTVALMGDRLAIVGTGSLTVKVAAPEVPPPLGLVTVMFTVPAVVRSLAGTWALSFVALE